MRILPVGRHALLLELADLAQAQAWYAELLRRTGRAGPVAPAEVVPGARTVLLDGLADPAAAAAELRTWPRPTADAAASVGQVISVPVRYDGPDLADVARRWDRSVAGVVRIHTGLTFTVAFCGFAPGFGYLAGLPEDLAVPRLESPRTSVPAGSVGLAASWCGVYPSASPGGWRLIGRTDLELFDLRRDPPALLSPGRRVRFVAVGP